MGLSPVTLPGFAKMLGGDEQKAWFEYCYLLRTAGSKLYDIPKEKFDQIEASCSKDLEGQRSCAEQMKSLIGADKVPDDLHAQLEMILKLAAKRYYEPDLDIEDNVALMVQAMVFGNFSDNDLVGVYHTRDIITGQAKLSGSFQRKAYTLGKKENENQLPRCRLLR